MTDVQRQVAGAASAEQWQMGVGYPAEGTVLVRLSGSWKMENRLPAVSEVRRQIETGRTVQRIVFDTQGVTAWDTGLLSRFYTLVPVAVPPTEADPSAAERGPAIGVGPVTLPGYLDCREIVTRRGRDERDEIELGEFDLWSESLKDGATRILGSDGKELALRRSTVAEVVGTPSYGAPVAAMNRALGGLSRDIATAIRAVPQ